MQTFMRLCLFVLCLLPLSDLFAEETVAVRSAGYRKLVFQNGKECLCEITSCDSNKFKMKVHEHEAWIAWNLVKQIEFLSSNTLLLDNARTFLDQGNRAKAFSYLSSALDNDPGATIDPPLEKLLSDLKEDRIQQQAQKKQDTLSLINSQFDRFQYSEALATLNALIGEYPTDQDLLVKAVQTEKQLKSSSDPSFDMASSSYIARLEELDPNSPVVTFAKRSRILSTSKRIREEREGKLTLVQAGNRQRQFDADETLRQKKLSFELSHPDLMDAYAREADHRPDYIWEYSPLFSLWSPSESFENSSVTSYNSTITYTGPDGMSITSSTQYRDSNTLKYTSTPRVPIIRRLALNPEKYSELPSYGVAENGSYYGELNSHGVPKTQYVRGYTRKDGTHVRGYYRSSKR